MSLELTDTDIRPEFNLKLDEQGITFLKYDSYWKVLFTFLKTVSVKYRSICSCAVIYGCYSQASGVFHQIVLAVY